MRQALCAVLLLLPWPQEKEIVLDRDDIVVTESVRVRPGTYVVKDENDDGVLHVRGSHITIDFAGATLSGAAAGTDADQFAGRGIVIEPGKNVTLKNAKLRGFKIACTAREVENLTVTGCDFSGNWRQRLKSTREKEAAEDWLFGHQNDANEWLRYGAGLYLDGCRGAVLHRNAGRNGQNGICLVRSEGCRVTDNDFSFNSGWGLALYRSCRNEVSHNKFDWCIRGFSHRVYHRGQDSAGILVYEQSSDNVFAFNSATHGGDGFFLWAGAETLEKTGEGGCNRNLLYRNDFSHAAANGIEATFSRENRFVENRLEECDHGIWAGYSCDTFIVGNTIARCANGVSIEHGNGNTIEGNRFEGNGIAVHLWWDNDADLLKTEYGQKRNCRSEKAEIARNTFRDDRLSIRLQDSSSITVEENEFASADTLLELSGTCPRIAVRRNNIGDVRDTLRNRMLKQFEFGQNWWKAPPMDATPLEKRVELGPLKSAVAPPKVTGTMDAFLPKGAPRGWKCIVMDEWGPFDFSRLLAFPRELAVSPEATLELLGPPAKFVIEGAPRGITVTPSEGRLPATVKVAADGPGGRTFELVVRLPERNESVRIPGFALVNEWTVDFYEWPAAGRGQPPKDWDAVVRAGPLDTIKVPAIDFLWRYDRPAAKVPADYFGLAATTELELSAGDYEVRTVSDDGVRVKIDGERVIDDWKWHGAHPETRTVKLGAGRHKIVVEYFEINGWAQLLFGLRPARK